MTPTLISNAEKSDAIAILGSHIKRLWPGLVISGTLASLGILIGKIDCYKIMG